MPDGVIVGGWNFVIAAYTVVGGVLVVYGVNLWRRAQRSKRESEQDS